MNQDICTGSSSLIRRFRRLALTVGLALIAGATPALGQPTQKRAAVLFGARAPYREAAEALTSELRASGYDCLSLELVADDETARGQVLKRAVEFKPDVVAATGSSAAAEALEAIPAIPVMFFMVPNARDAPFMAARRATDRRLAGVTSDVSPAGQMEWIARTAPRCRRVAVLCSTHSRRTAADLVEAGRRRNLTVSAVEARRDRFPDAIESLNEGGYDGVLMIPDAQVYNSPNVQRLLLWGVRQRNPVWTFSRNVVKAGAYSGLYCDSAAIGRQAARIVKEIVAGRSPDSIGMQYPEQVRRAVNVHTAAMIGAELDDAVFTPDVIRMGEQP